MSEEKQDNQNQKFHALVGNRSLAEVEAMYGSLVETLPAIVYVAESIEPYSTIYISPNIESLGFTREEWINQPDSWLNSIHPEDRERVLQKTAEAMKLEQENDYEYRVVAKDGAIRWWHDKGKFVLGETGAPICWQGVLLDITERKKSEEEREFLIERLRAARGEIKALSGLLPICSYCRNVRNDQNYWQSLEIYLAEHSAAQFSHGICPGCYENILRPKLNELKETRNEKQTRS